MVVLSNDICSKRHLYIIIINVIILFTPTIKEYNWKKNNVLSGREANVLFFFQNQVG